MKTKRCPSCLKDIPDHPLHGIHSCYDAKAVYEDKIKDLKKEVEFLHAAMAQTSNIQYAKLKSARNERDALQQKLDELDRNFMITPRSLDV